MQALQAQVQQECAVGREHGAKVPHKLGGAFGDERAAQAEALSVGHAVIALVRRAEAGVFLSVFRPVEFPRVEDAATQGRAVAIHILRCRMGDDIRAPGDGLAVDGGGKCVIHNQGNAVGVGSV